MKQAIRTDANFSTCPSCGVPVRAVREERDSFSYRSGETVVELFADVPVYSCAGCGVEFTDEEAEDRRHAAVCRHLGVLTPAEIRSLRLSHNLSRSEFARLTGIGDATIARWERGSLIQNAGYDQLLRLLRHRDNIERLRARAAEHNNNTGATSLAKFRYLTRTAELEVARASFRLQKAKS